MKPNNIQIAGTKDRRGITSQLMSIRRVEPSRVFNLSKCVPGLFLGNYCFKDKPLRLGDLKGNQFRIALRYSLAVCFNVTHVFVLTFPNNKLHDIFLTEIYRDLMRK